MNFDEMNPILQVKNAKAKEIYQHNDTSSNFLRLPGEVRTMVYKHIFGNKIVHLNYGGHTDDPYEIEDIAKRQDASYLWCHILCQKDRPEDIPDLETDDCRIRGGRHTHLRSSQCNKACAPQLCFSVLRACRQIYAEAYMIPWVTNTFSFSDFVTFRAFLDGTARSRGRTVWQKKALKSLRLGMSIKHHFDWGYNIKARHCDELTGLRHLRLHIEHSMTMFAEPTYEDLLFHEDKSAAATTGVFPYGIGLKRLSIIPWNNVEVVCQLIDGTRNPARERVLKTCRNLAILYKNCLLDPYAPRAYDYDLSHNKDTRMEACNLFEIQQLGFIAGRLVFGFPGYEKFARVLKAEDEEGYEMEVQGLLEDRFSRSEIPIEIVQKALLVPEDMAAAFYEKNYRRLQAAESPDLPRL